MYGLRRRHGVEHHRHGLEQAVRGDEQLDSDDEWSVEQSIPSTPSQEEDQEGDLIRYRTGLKRGEKESGDSLSLSNPEKPRPLSEDDLLGSLRGADALDKLDREILEGIDSGTEGVDVEDADAEDVDAEERDDRQCRICFAGAEEEDSLGRLISPCLCTGSMRVSHFFQPHFPFQMSRYRGCADGSMSMVSLFAERD